MSKESKCCKYCFEEIHINAIKCKHCGEFLTKQISSIDDRIDTNDEIEVFKNTREYKLLSKCLKNLKLSHFKEDFYFVDADDSSPFGGGIKLFLDLRNNVYIYLSYCEITTNPKSFHTMLSLKVYKFCLSIINKKVKELGDKTFDEYLENN